MSLTFKLKYSDGSSRIYSTAGSVFIGSTIHDTAPIAFEYCPAQSSFDPQDPPTTQFLDFYFLWRFYTNPILWAISVNTCPEELRPFLTLEPHQLTYKGSS
jgi:hypothetical protein